MQKNFILLGLFSVYIVYASFWQGTPNSTQQLTENSHTAVVDSQDNNLGNDQPSPFIKVNLTQSIPSTNLSGDVRTPEIVNEIVEADYIFSAPPRESRQESKNIYGPIAEYLSQVTGKKVIYTYPDNWLSYQTEMVAGSYDIIFDQAHFNSWRIAHLNHTPLTRIVGDYRYVIITKKNSVKNEDFKLSSLEGRKICVMDVHDLGTLEVMKKFTNPTRQPVVINHNRWNKIYQQVVMGSCDAGVLPFNILTRYDVDSSHTEIVYRTKLLPNQVFSAGPRVTRSDQLAITRGLTNGVAKKYLSKLHDSNATHGLLSVAKKSDVAGLDKLLKDNWTYQ